MSTVERIQKLLDYAIRVPEKDAAGIITTAGGDSAIRIKTLKECLAIAKDEEIKRECN